MTLLNQEDIKKLEIKICALEKMTSAEFKIIVCKHAWLGIRWKASRLFKKYKLGKTTHRNAVLLLVIEKDKELLIYGDKGIYQNSSTQNWPVISEAILKAFKSDDFYLGLSSGIELIAGNLIKHFPADNNKKNEVSNAILFI